MSSERILIFVPTYNESANVEAMARQLLALDLDADVAFCDDNSPDGTGAILDRLAASSARIRALHRPSKLGIGSAHQTGIQYAYDRGYDVLITLDCDFTHQPADLPRLYRECADTAVTLGS